MILPGWVMPLCTRTAPTQMTAAKPTFSSRFITGPVSAITDEALDSPPSAPARDQLM